MLDAGPIPYSAIELFGDADLEHGLRHAGFDPVLTTYRLIEIPVASISEAPSMPWPSCGTEFASEIAGGVVVPPIVVVGPHDGWGLLDGVNRTNAYVLLGRERILAYEVLLG